MFQVRIHGRGGRGGDRRRDALDRGLRGRAPRAGVPDLRLGAHRGAGDLLRRIDEAPIRSREPISEPDALIVQDPTLLHQVDLFAGLSDHGYVLINSSRSFDELRGSSPAASGPSVCSPCRRPRSPASTSAARCRTPCSSAASARSSGVVAIGSVVKAIGDKFGARWPRRTYSPPRRPTSTWSARRRSWSPMRRQEEDRAPSPKRRLGAARR